jgi:phosphatidylserine/phosphatidylglycerophosphate/cardiolipin synthase-like enzyme
MIRSLLSVSVLALSLLIAGCSSSSNSGGTTGGSSSVVVSLSASAFTFANTPVGSTSAAQTVTVSNTGTATATFGTFQLTGNTADFNESATTCTGTLAAGASCALTFTFIPQSEATFTLTASLSDNAANSPQTLTLTGTGTAVVAPTVSRQFYVFPESDNSVTPLYTLVNGATRTIDMTMYALQDATFTADLVAACKRGVTVRVILDQNDEKSNDTPDFNLLNAQSGCTAVWANKAFQVTHEKSFIVDGTAVAIMSLNLQQQYYSTTRDYALVENDANDIAAIQATFNQDFAAGTLASGVVPSSSVTTADYNYLPPAGDDLAWSPTTATASMLAIINNATKTLYIENEEFSAPNIVSAIAAAASRGVAVIYIGEYSSSYVSNYATVKSAGGSVYYYSSSNGFYVHGKAVAADVGLSTEAVYMGSINYSTASLTENRELGVYITGNTTVSHPLAVTISATVLSDETQAGVTHY